MTKSSPSCACAFDRQALKTVKTTDYRRTGWTQRNHRAADARLADVLNSLDLL